MYSNIALAYRCLNISSIGLPSFNGQNSPSVHMPFAFYSKYFFHFKYLFEKVLLKSCFLGFNSSHFSSVPVPFAFYSKHFFQFEYLFENVLLKFCFIWLTDGYAEISNLVSLIIVINHHTIIKFLCYQIFFVIYNFLKYFGIFQLIWSRITQNFWDSTPIVNQY